MSALNRHPSHPHRVLSLAILFVVLALSALSLTQCRMVNQNVTGVDPSLSSTFHGHSGRSSSRTSKCEKTCRKTFNSAMKSENKRHHEALEDCGRNKACRKKENAYHDDVVDGLRDEWKKCVDGCHYKEGGGKGGR